MTELALLIKLVSINLKMWSLRPELRGIIYHRDKLRSKSCSS